LTSSPRDSRRADGQWLRDYEGRRGHQSGGIAPFQGFQGRPKGVLSWTEYPTTNRPKHAHSPLGEAWEQNNRTSTRAKTARCRGKGPRPVGQLKLTSIGEAHMVLRHGSATRRPPWGERFLAKAVTRGRDQGQPRGCQPARRLVAADIAFRSELELIESGGFPALKTTHILSQPPNDWVGPISRLDTECLRSLCGGFSGKAFFICCPPEMASGLICGLRNSGVGSGRIHADYFGL
jgi:hypothetical protein